ncbi:NAD(P)-dependent alcohol dehydrogenase [Bacillus salacetis]|uniref:NAD(P)-dependent alcohol dehydrogenase n=1 Tax=Bacillus salacetis TaxID=2315464 RepID=A0A3A1R3X2_9BACI|nr:zinc-binding dehydrogenase [Bacillus salacetis]RIW37244.1 NAD(P)-dependent alcohol dehydrogenase [Bacillus salacetis]
MKAIVHEGKKGMQGLSLKDFQEPEAGSGMVKIKLMTAGLNRRDLMVLNRHKEDQPPLIIGSDGAGIVIQTGDGVTNVAAGEEIIINPGLGWEKNTDAPPSGFEIVGLPGHGTFAEYITLPAENVEKKPAHLNWEEAGVLSLAALTAYRVLFTRAKVKEGDTVLIPGIGSGVGTFLLKFAKAAGARTIVTSRSQDKQKKAMEFGADLAISTTSDWNEELKDETVDIVIESIGRATFEKSLQIVRKGGTVATFGATTDDIVEIDIRHFFYGQLNLLGSTMGSTEEFKEMLDFIERHNIKPVLDSVFELDEFEIAFDKLKNSENLGKIAFRVSE